MNSSRYEGLDALRVFCSFGVVLVHVYAATGDPVSLALLIKLRDFALPVMALMSFFLLTKSLMRQQKSGAAVWFFSRRAERLWIPLIIWTLVYCSVQTFVFPVIFGSEGKPEFPSSGVFLIGYRHLWYLQFVFIASLAIYLVFTVLKKLRISPAKLTAGCFLFSLIYALLYYSLIKDFAVWHSDASEFDLSLRIFFPQVSYYVMYIPAGVGIALISDKISQWFARPVIRRLSLGMALIAAAAHIGTNEFVRTKEVYGLAVFLLALQPFGKIRFGFVRVLAKYSYGIYILHFLPAQILAVFVSWKYFEPTAVNVLGSTIIIYLISFAAAFLIRKIFKAAWLLPVAGSRSEKTAILRRA